MAKVNQLRGALLEEAVLLLLEKVGYKVIRKVGDSIDTSDLKQGKSEFGVKVQGRGSWHQIDALAEQEQISAFLHPLRLLVEAKCYPKRKIGLPIVRNSVGVIKDISENYFTKKHLGNTPEPIRFNYQAAIFSASEFTKLAMDYAFAHQIFLIEYKQIPVIAPVIEGIKQLQDDSLKDGIRQLEYDSGKRGIRSSERDGSDLTQLREAFRDALRFKDSYGSFNKYFEPAIADSIHQISSDFKRIKGSYFGMLQGRWPLHLLTEVELPAKAFRKDIVECHLEGDNFGNWSFTPSNFKRGEIGWFELQFFLPKELARKIAKVWDDPNSVAAQKSQDFSYLSLSGRIGGIWRNVRVELDPLWLSTYLRDSNSDFL